MNKNVKSIIIYFLIVILSLIIINYELNDEHNYNVVNKKLNSLSNNIVKVIYYPLYFNDKKNIVITKENKMLKKEIKEYKRILKLNKKYNNRNLVNANIIKRSSPYLYNTITINKGKKQGVKKGSIVINDKGTIGKIIKVYNNSSDIKLLTSNNKNYLSVMFNYENNNYYGLISNYNYKKNELTISNVIGDLKNINGIYVYTSGLNNNVSKGFLVGKIKRIKKEKYSISNSVYITPSVNFNNINLVSVVIS